jgi:hypothetical protein
MASFAGEDFDWAGHCVNFAPEARALLRATLVQVTLALTVSTTNTDTLASLVGSTFHLAHGRELPVSREAIWAALEASFSGQAMFDQLFGLPAGQIRDLTLTVQHRLGMPSSANGRSRATACITDRCRS